MTRTFSGQELVIASHNAGKVREIAALFAGRNIKVFGAMECGLEEPEETGNSFIENAEIKAYKAAITTKKTALADDSGLVIPSLDGAPGIYSARWAGSHRDFSVAITRVKDELIACGKMIVGTEAYFICALSLCWPDGHCETFEGQVDGMLTYPPTGNRGFGYDPIFIPNGFQKTFGEMLPEIKEALSHRRHAFDQLEAACLLPTI